MATDLGTINVQKNFQVDPIKAQQMFAQKRALLDAQNQRRASSIDTGMENPYQAYKDHPFLMGLSTLAMGIGEGMTGRPFLTNFNNNLYEQKQAQLKYKQWQQEMAVKAQEERMQNELRQSQIDLNKKMSESAGAGQDIVYRDPITGVEVPKEVAVSDIQAGHGRYVINQRRVTKSGVIETPVVKPDALTQDERTYITTAERMKKNLTALSGGLDYIYDKKGNPLWKQYQAESVPFAAVTDPKLQKFKSSLNMLKADLPFLRGGKQLTPTEAKRVDVLLNPLGKKKEVYEADLKAFQDEFMSGESLAKYGLSPMGLSGKGEKKSAIDSSDPRVIKARQAGYTDEEIASYLNKR